jgi:hypothetical protein
MNFSVFVVLAAALTSAPAAASDVRIHSISDISHEFTFYMDGRFWSQYIGKTNGEDARNWGTLYKLDLKNINLLVLFSGPGPVPYTAKDIAHVRSFVQDGGTALVMSDAPGGKQRFPFPIQTLANAFGAAFLPVPAQKPLRAAPFLNAARVQYRDGGILQLTRGWNILVTDRGGRPLMAQRQQGKGNVLVASRGLFGHEPDGSDPVNAEWIAPLLKELVRNRPVWILLHPLRGSLPTCRTIWATWLWSTTKAPRALRMASLKSSAK